jgi:hypothetical protein
MNLKSTTMNASEISRLLEKYFNGQSSEEEELILRDYFTGNNISEEFSVEKEIFRHYSRSAIVTEPSVGLAERIISAIDSEEEKENSFRFYRRRMIAFFSVAAGLLIAVAVYFFLKSESAPKDTYTDPEIAYAETVRILYDVSSQLNHGTNQLNNVVKMEDAAVKSFTSINRSTTIIVKNLKNLDYFEQAFNIVSSPMGYIKNK